MTNLFLISILKLYFPSTSINLLSYLADAWGLSVKENIWVTGGFTLQCKESFSQIALWCWHGSPVTDTGTFRGHLFRSFGERAYWATKVQPAPPPHCPCQKKQVISTLSSLQCWLRSHVRPHFQSSLVPFSQEDHLEKQMATHSSILAWEISWTEEPGGLQSAGSQRLRQDWATNTFTSKCVERRKQGRNLNYAVRSNVANEDACRAKPAIPELRLKTCW